MSLMRWFTLVAVSLLPAAALAQVSSGPPASSPPAQTAQPSSSSSPQPGAKANPQQGGPSSSGDASSQPLTLAHASAGERRVTQLLGATIYGRNQEAIGVLNDVLFGHKGHAATAVIALAGFLDEGDKNIALPFAQLKPMHGAEGLSRRSIATGQYTGSSPLRFSVALSRQQIGSAPSFRATLPPQSAGTPETTSHKPKSSTQSGGPG